MRKAILLYGVLNALAYSALLPLWEGFDEAYHYGYFQFLSTRHAVPSLNHAPLSREIWHGFELAPVSHYLQAFTRAPINFEDYFKFTSGERADRRKRLDSLPASEKFEIQPDKPNYEVNQSPLPYLWMAGMDAALASRSLPARVLALRMVCSVLAILLLAHAALLLAREIGLPESYANAMLLCVFSSQMLYATLCHVCNDWLAVPLFTYFLWAAIRVVKNGSRRDCLLFGATLTAGLLAKAYFLVMVPLAAAIVVRGLWRRRIDFTAAAMFAIALIPAAPWFVRNVVLYHNLSATVETTSGISLRQLMDAAIALPWPKSIGYMAHASLWTGNNSFTMFSSATLNLILVLLAVALALNFQNRRLACGRGVIAAAVILFSLGLAYVSVTFYASSKGGAIAAVPWYMQVLLAPVLALAFAGLRSAGKWGAAIGRITLFVWTYVLVATWIVKLIPMYGGFGEHRAHVSDLWNWYLEDSARRNEILAAISLAKPAVIYALVIFAIALGVTCCCMLAARFETAPEPRPPGTTTL